MYKCRNANGEVAFSDKVCPEKSETTLIETPAERAIRLREEADRRAEEEAAKEKAIQDAQREKFAPIILAFETSLWLWAPMSIDFNGSRVTVVTKEYLLTKKIYHAMIAIGTCPMVITDPGMLSNVSEILILERDGRSGLLFMGGELQCTKLVNTPISEAKGIDALVDAKTLPYPSY